MNKKKSEWQASDGLKAQAAVVELLKYIGEDPAREGLRDTPARVCKAWREMTAGYAQDPAKILGTDFDVGRYDEMILVPDISFTSICEHHMLSFEGVAHVAYLPNRKTLRCVGLSKIPRVVEAFARRLQVQERMTMQIAETIGEHLKASGVGVIVQAKHSCMCARGVKQKDASMVTSALLGEFRRATTRAEFQALVAMTRTQK